MVRNRLRSSTKKPREIVRKRSRPRQRTERSLEFNHAMIYVSEISRSLRFYTDILGFQIIEEYPGAYARLRSPKGSTTIALHVIGEHGERMDPRLEGMRLYFETRDLDAFCNTLQEKGVHFKELPKDMPWGWRHAYLTDPDGHELSLYWAGKKRLSATRMN